MYMQHFPVKHHPVKQNSHSIIEFFLEKRRNKNNTDSPLTSCRSDGDRKEFLTKVKVGFEPDLRVCREKTKYIPRLCCRNIQTISKKSSHLKPVEAKPLHGEN